MRLEHDDSRLTAFVLDELSPADAAEVEALLEADPGARAAVEAIRSASRLVAEALAAEAAPALTEQQRRAAGTPPAGERTGLHLAMPTFPRLALSRRWAAATAAVAVVAVVAGAAWNFDVAGFYYWLDQARSSSGHDSAERNVGPDYRITIGDLLRSGGDPGAAAELSGAPVGSMPEHMYMKGAESLPAAEPGGPAPMTGGIEPSPADPWYREDFQTEGYDPLEDNPFREVSADPLSTFSIDVDTASYANVRRWLNAGQLPPQDAVRIEELINYFPYDYAPPEGDGAPFAVHTAVAGAPWQPQHRLVRIALKGREVDTSQRPPCNLVFLVDVSGSMLDANKLPLVQGALRMLVETLRPDDRVALAVYAGASGLVLPPTSGGDKATILAAIDVLEAGGSTNGGEGIELAYRTARENRIDGGANRVILCTDGDFNVGITDRGSFTRMVEERARDGVFLTVLGFGMGNYRDDMLEGLADKGNGNYGYVDSLSEARKVLVEQATGTLLTIAKDVKVQVEFNPARVSAWRLIGYENRVLSHQDFNDDTKDAGDIGAGHTLTALYEVVPVGAPVDVPGVDPLKYQQPPSLSAAAEGGALLTVKLRYKEPEGRESRLLESEVADEATSMDAADPEFQFAAAVAAFGMVLRDSPYRGGASLDMAGDLARRGLGADRSGYRSEFLGLVRAAAPLLPRGREVPADEPWPAAATQLPWVPTEDPFGPEPTATPLWSWPPAPVPYPSPPPMGQP